MSKWKIGIAVGIILVLLCAVFYALHIAFLDLVCFHDDSVPVAFWQLRAR